MMVPSNAGGLARAWWRGAGILARLPVSVVLSAGALFFALVLCAAAAWGPAALRHTAADNDEFRALLEQQGLPALVQEAAVAVTWSVLALGLAGALGLLQRRWTLALLRCAYVFTGLVAVLFGYESLAVWGLLREKNIALDGREPSEYIYYFGALVQLSATAAVLALSGFLLVLSCRRRTLALYARDGEIQPTAADRVLAFFRNLWRRPFLRALGSSTALHACLILLPMLFLLFGKVRYYMIPYGHGLPDAGGGAKTGQEGSLTGKSKGKTAGKKPGEKKPGEKKAVEVKLTQKPGVGRISYIFASGKKGAPALLGDEALEKFEAETQDQYQSESMRIIAGGRGSGTGGGFGPGNKAGGVGAGGVGPGGWPEGTRNALFQFIRLQYRGEGWDDGMGGGQRSDVNFLEFWHREIGGPCGFRTASSGDKISFARLKACEKGAAPPFVFMTGRGGIEVSASEMKILRDYLLGGGMLFADCSSPGWGRSFRGFVAQLFPERPLVNITDDDIIYRHPFTFTNGAPPLWHHDGWRALGVRHEQQNRWLVFYHPGDMHDAWKTGCSGMDAEMAERSFQLGVNLVYHAFCNYAAVARKKGR